MDNNSNDSFSDDEHFWMGNEEAKQLYQINTKFAQSDTSDYESAGDTTRKKSRKILYMIIMFLIF